MKKSFRLKDWNYAQSYSYFVTINTYKFQPFFGSVVNSEMVLNSIGNIAHNEWLRTSDKRPHTELGEFVIMPNHVHLIIHFHPSNELAKGTHSFGNVQNSLPSLIRGYKCAVTSAARKTKPKFGWKTGFHDRLLKSKSAVERASNYIRENPKNYHK